MKEIYLKVTTDGIALPHIELAQICKPGNVRWNVSIVKIYNVPDNIDWFEVKNLFEVTVIMDSDLCVFDYNELGLGKMIWNDATRPHGILKNGIARILIIWDNGEESTLHLSGQSSLKENMQETINLMHGTGKGLKEFSTEVLAWYKNRNSFTAHCGTESFAYDRHSN